MRTLKELDQKIQEYVELNREIQKLETEKKKLREEILKFMKKKNLTERVTDVAKVTYSNVVTNYIDVNKLKKDGLYDKYVKQKESERLFFYSY